MSTMEGKRPTVGVILRLITDEVRHLMVTGWYSQCNVSVHLTQNYTTTEQVSPQPQYKFVSSLKILIVYHFRIHVL